MTSSKSSVIQFNDEQDPQAELQFQDFSLAESSSGIATLSPTGTYTNFPDTPDSHANESEDLLGEDKKEDTSVWKFSYYQSFFDIETADFLERLKWSFIPVLGRATFLDRQIRPKPDLYGPFWITFCLIYSTAIMSNVANYFNGAVHNKKDMTFNFHRVSLSATTIYAYVFVLPIILWGVLRHFQYSNKYTLLEIISVYGYSLALFVPISIFWIFDAAWLHWILVIVGIALTGTVLLQVFWPIFRDDNKKTGTILLGIILICHILLGVGFGTLFFQERVTWVSTSTAVTVPSHTSTAVTSGPVKISRSIENTAAKINASSLDQKMVKDLVKNKTGNVDHLMNKLQSKINSSELKSGIDKTGTNMILTEKDIVANHKM